MKIHTIEWKNYRRLADGRLEVRNHLVLVGPNDSGKSSILRALHLCLGMPGTQLASAFQPRDLTSADEPLLLEVVLHKLSDDDRAAFPDEIEVGPPETLTIRIEVRVDADGEIVVERRFPFAGHTRGISRVQIEQLGWTFVSATRSLARELGSTGGAAHDLLSRLDLSADVAAFDAASDSFRAALTASTAVTDFRTSLADALSAALPKSVTVDDIGVSSAADLLAEPLAGASVTIRDGEHVVPIAEQSDGVRALSAMALLGLSNQDARIVGIDEPETHLHATAQRAVAASLDQSGGQRVLATHSSAVVSRMDPLDIAAFGADRRARQLPVDAPVALNEVAIRYWGHRMIEPLTAERILIVEGVSDRILVDRIARLLGLNLDRIGTAIFELDGADLFGTAYGLFGADGFDLPIVGLVDSDAAETWATDLGVSRADLGTVGVVECDPDLEAVYVSAIGATRIVDVLVAAKVCSEVQLLASCGVASKADLTDELVAAFCRKRRRKVRAATAVASAMTVADAPAVTPIVALLALVTP